MLTIQKSHFRRDTSDNFSLYAQVCNHPEKEESGTVINNDTGVAKNVNVTFDHFEKMFMKSVTLPYSIINNIDTVKIIELYNSTMNLYLIIKRNMTLQLYLYNGLVPIGNDVTKGITTGQLNIESVIQFLNRLKLSHVCVGNTETELLKLMPEGTGLYVAGEKMKLHI